MGFAVDFVDGASRAGPEHAGQCRVLLSKVHDMGIKHGDINRHNFLVKGDRTWLVDWESAQKCDDPDELQAEMDALDSELRDKSGKGRPSTYSIHSMTPTHPKSYPS